MSQLARALIFLLACFLCAAQPKTTTPREDADLEQALSEAGSSPIEYLRAIEKHLQKYPDSPRKPELERAAFRAAVEANDARRTILFGERVLAREPDDLQALERVTRALLAGDSKELAERALKYARHYEDLIRKMKANGSAPGVGAADFQNQTDRALGRVLIFQARATGNLGRIDEAVALAGRAFDTWPNAESARETAKWYELLGKPQEAARRLADAFTIPDDTATAAARERDRVRMGELYRQAKGSDTGLGDLVLEAYDRNVALLHARELRIRALDPNSQLTNPMEFTLAAVDGPKLAMASLKGKVLILDFWATWCVPCRAQHPLFEKVKQQFKADPDVVFLSIAADDDRAEVKPFLAEMKWPGPVYYEDGLSRALRVSEIPATVIIDRQGRIVSRLNGFAPERFVDMLSERIREALSN